jgi:hypothetical protein
MPRKLIPLAIAYDFDGTLAPGNMQEHSFIPDLGIKKRDFWGKVKQNAKDHDMDEILSYMDLMLREANNLEKPITKKAFANHGKGLNLYAGVNEWFPVSINMAKLEELGYLTILFLLAFEKCWRAST